MKRITNFTVALVIMLGLGFNAEAQISYGVKAGVNSSVQSKIGNLYDGDNFKPGLVLGIKTGYSFTNILSLSAELNYEGKGSQTDVSLNNSTESVVRDFNYLSVPLLLNAGFSNQLGLQPNWKIYGSFGPYYSWLLSAQDFSGSTEISNQTNVENAASDNDWGLVFGIGVSHKIKSFEVYTDLRYDMGLNEIISTDKNLRNKTIALTVGINL